MSDIPDALYEGALGDEEAASVITRWFLENYEDPVPRYGRSGYDGAWGPYDSDELVEFIFPSLNPDQVRRAIVNIQRSGGREWVPHFDRIPRPEEAARGNEVHAEMLRRIALLEERLQRVEPALAGQGHNNPPGPIDDSPFTLEDRQELRAALNVLRAQPVNPPDRGASAREATSVVQSKGVKLAIFLGGLSVASDITSLWQAYGRSVLDAINSLVLVATTWFSSLPPL